MGRRRETGFGNGLILPFLPPPLSLSQLARCPLSLLFSLLYILFFCFLLSAGWGGEEGWAGRVLCRRKKRERGEIHKVRSPLVTLRVESRARDSSIWRRHRTQGQPRGLFLHLGCLPQEALFVFEKKGAYVFKIQLSTLVAILCTRIATNFKSRTNDSSSRLY